MEIGIIPYSKRVNDLRSEMQSESIDVVLVPPGPNFFYFTGMETESMERLTLLIIKEDSVDFLCPELMRTEADKITSVDSVLSWKDEDNPFTILRKMISGKKRIAVEGSLPYFQFSAIDRVIEGEKCLADPLLEKLRIIKDSYELELIREAVKRSEMALSDSLVSMHDQMTEIELSKILENNMYKHGLSMPAFPTIVGFGHNSAIPHHMPDQTRIKENDSIVIDFGGRYNGYASDTTRTFFWKKCSDEMSHIYDAVKEANEQSRSYISPDTRYSDIDRKARSIISKEGYGERFIHRLGHGLGIQVHEQPYLVNTNDVKVIRNSVFTIEPGIYIPNRGGVRIEDTNYFDGTKCISFNCHTRDLTIL